ncbi:ABC transporter substrate-binding protein [Cellulomonas bogoriensis]|uniref:Thiamine pyrimidine synthase n=1 Tax=Cellulomonas bogoriensis 69B4 = DSM 16987 TaxID=1386082 RepID=A0A0A0BQ04_9CELL|nr:ABC transporter substrate-binding protein [Cellulomonas bogoriensis]KGM09159.1 nitrate ABC transporter substrate-binding protein [Cellulomonas bogoriensis 69B4 = DSM 16987]
MPAHTRRTTGAVLAGSLALTLAACTSEEPTAAGPDGEGATVATDVDTDSPTYLGDVCPSTVTTLTDWMPQSEHGELYQLLGDDAEIDTDLKRIAGTLVDTDGADTGVRLEIRAGGPAIGFDSGANQLYSDESLMLTYISTDDAVAAAAQGQPVVSVLAAKETSPTAIMWDPQTYPDLETIADVGEAGITVRYTNGLTYMEYLLAEGILSEDQVDSSYDGSPGAFVADGGTAAQQGYATAEPYMYDQEIPQWGRALEFDLVANTGYRIYVQSLSARADRVEEFADCFDRLVPIVQQAQVDFLDDPARANALIVEAVEAYDLGWQYSEGLADYSVQAQRDLGIVDNGHDSTLGNHELDRVDDLIAAVTPILVANGLDVPQDLTAEDIVTNEFIDESIGLP